MKKIILFFTFVFALCVTTNAQSLVPRSFDFLRGQTNLGITIDMTGTTIDGTAMKSYLELNLSKDENVEEWMKKSNAELTEELVFAFNKTMRKKKCGLNSIRVDSFNYQATVKAVSFTKKGDLDAVVTFTKVGSDEVLARVALKGNGGKFSSLNNLMGDGCKDAGTKLAKMLEVYLK